METSMFFFAVFESKPKTQTSELSELSCTSSSVYHISFYKDPVDLRTSLVAPEAHELRGLRGSWGIFSMSQILRRIRPPDHVFQKLQM